MSSDDSEKKTTANTENGPEDVAKDNVSEIFETEDSENEEVSSQDPTNDLEKVTKDFLYLRAEFENYKRNAIKDRVALQKYGAQRLALDLLPVLDVFNQALTDLPSGKDEDPFVQGIKMTHKELIQSLEKHGIKEVPTTGQTFNPEFHEALGTEPTSDFKEGEICRVFKAPYKYHEKLLRAGQVFVAVPPQSKD